MEQTITTHGSGVALGVPDAMRLSVTVATRAANVSGALAGAADGVRSAGEIARRFTDASRITSTGLSVWPHLGEDGRRRGYDARHSLEIRCPGLEAAGDLVGALGDEVQTIEVNGIEPVLTDPAPLATAARERAWQDALSKATELAGLAGLELGATVSVAEAAAAGDGPVLKMAAGTPTRFEAGSLSVSAGVTVTWSAYAP